MSAQKVQPGSLLISEPYMLDTNFKRAVILLCDHSPENGSVGFILNHPMEYLVQDMLPDFPEFSARTYFGGPVAENTLHFVHNVGNLVDDSVRVSHGIYWGGDFEKLKFLVENQLIEPHQIRFYVGYTGWSAGQLEEELRDGSWIVSQTDANYVFNTKPTELWQKAMSHLGGSHSILAEIPDHQNAN